MEVQEVVLLRKQLLRLLLNAICCMSLELLHEYRVVGRPPDALSSPSMLCHFQFETELNVEAMVSVREIGKKMMV